ncbi:hypothetical protein E2986_10715 [Frieseomelitta varia]|uniref:Uncharacterized protein n=1 Tax=Frieseomelitta varia TaxID=561572 RepID=A0A833RYC3_9HYME|nr:hypothetical protein E2986_10715 [Frieseomelitta varia]
MTKLLHTIGALLLNAFGLQIFRTCFANAVEDEECGSLLSGPPFSSVFFSIATAFILEFASACIWTPIDVLLSTTLPSYICHTLRQLGFDGAAVSFLADKSLTTVLTYTVAIAFLLLTLHVVDAVDYAVLRDCGTMCFLTHVQEKLWARMQREFPFFVEAAKGSCRCKVRGKRRSKSRGNSGIYFVRTEMQSTNGIDNIVSGIAPYVIRHCRSGVNYVLFDKQYMKQFLKTQCQQEDSLYSSRISHLLIACTAHGLVYVYPTDALLLPYEGSRRISSACTCHEGSNDSPQMYKIRTEFIKSDFYTLVENLFDSIPPGINPSGSISITRSHHEEVTTHEIRPGPNPNHPPLHSDNSTFLRNAEILFYLARGYEQRRQTSHSSISNST